MARYNVAILPENHPRLFTANSGPGGDLGYYFQTYGHNDVAAFVRRDQARVNAINNADVLGILRRMIVFNPTREQIGFRVQNMAAHGQVH